MMHAKKILIILLVAVVLIGGCVGQTPVVTEGNITQPPQPAPLFGPTCGNRVCESGENSQNCCKDCGCEAGLSCVENACRPQCGDGICAGGENQNTCCQDCGCVTGSACQNGVCVELIPQVRLTPSLALPGRSSVTQLKAVGKNLETCLLNTGNDDARNIEITASSRDYYFASSSQNVGTLSKNSQNCYTLNLVFTNSVLDITSETTIPVSIDLSYYNSANKQYQSKESTSIDVTGRNYFWWSPIEMISMWVTPLQPTIREFASKATGGIATYVSSLQQKMAARWIFESMRAYGVKYTTDAHTSADYVQFPIETLRNKGGDCEDNAILFASMLEAVGIESVVILIPGHAFSGYINKENQLVLVETTANDFDTALSAGYYGYQQNLANVQIIYPSRNWNSYPQVILSETTQLAMPSITKQIGTCGVAWNLELGFYISAPVTFVNSGNAPGAGCAALSAYDKNNNKLSEDLSCWVVNPGQTLTKDYAADIAMTNWLEGYYCRSY